MKNMKIQRKIKTDRKIESNKYKNNKESKYN
jgi:hypothetical protein